MHGELGRPNVHGADPRVAGSNRPNGGATRGVGLDAKFLHGDLGQGGELAHQRSPQGVGGVALVGVVLEHRAAVEPRLVGGVVPVAVVGVHLAAGSVFTHGRH